MRFSLGLLALLAFLVWQLVSGKYGDYTTPATWRQIKIITKGHFAFVGEGDRGVKDMKSAADSLQVLRTMFSGGGTYTLNGNSYKETVEYFADPAGLGLSIVCGQRHRPSRHPRVRHRVAPEALHGGDAGAKSAGGAGFLASPVEWRAKNSGDG